MTETWLKETGTEITINEVVPQDYSILTENRQTIRGGGVAIIFKSKLDLKRIPNCATTSFQYIEVEINKSHSNYPTRIICLYRPPSSCVSSFFSELSELLSKRTTLQIKILLAGDFNIHFDSQNDRQRNTLASLLDEYGLKQMVNKPTHEAGHILDLICTHSTNVLNLNIINIKKVGISDHFLIEFVFTLQKLTSKRPLVAFSRRLKHINNDSFSLDLKESFLKLSSKLTTNEFAEQINEIMSSTLNKHAPLKRNNTKLMSEPWMTPEILDKRRFRRCLERRAIRKNTIQDWLQYKITLKETAKMVRKAKSNYFKGFISSCINDQQKLTFTVTKQLLKNNMSEFYPDVEDAPNKIAKYFQQKIENLKSLLANSSVKDHIPPQNIPPILNEFEKTDITEVTNIINKYPIKTSIQDPLPRKILKTNINDIIPTLVILINKSLESTEFPSVYKAASITPLPKNSKINKNELSNYRPISNLAFFGKVMERIIAKRIHQHLENNQLYEQFQSAYKPYHSVETALIQVTDNILCNIDDNNSVLLILLDLSAAFDTLDHKILLNTLTNWFGIEKKALQWIGNYLSNRTYTVQIKDHKSASINLSEGVPQGSVLGPVLFTAYVTPLAALIKSLSINYHLYADDTQIWTSFNSSDPLSLTKAIEKVESCLEKIKAWMNSHKLMLNEKKTKFIIISRKKNLDPISIKFNNIVIFPTKMENNLGVEFDNQLSFINFISTKCRKGYFWLQQIKRIKPFIPSTSTALLTNAYVTTSLDNCNSLLTGLPAYQLQRLQRLQNYAARITLNDYNFETPSHHLLRKLHWLNIENRIKFKILTLVHRSISGKAPSYMKDLLKTRDIPTTTTRYSLAPSFHCPIANFRKTGDRAFSNTAPSLWNKLPSNLRSIQSTTIFKKNLKTHLFQL